MQNISKKLIGAIIVFVIVLVEGGWFWYASKMPSQEQMPPVVTENQNQQVTENQTQETDVEIVARNLDVSKWKTYRNDEYGIEFKYPEELIDVFQSTEQPNNITLSLFFKVPGNTVKTPIFTFSFYGSDLNDEYIKPNSKYFSCDDIFAVNEKAKLCYLKNSDRVIIRKDYKSFTDRGVCSTHENRGSEFIIEIPLKNMDQTKRFNQIYTTLSCDHSQNLGKIYKTIYQSINFFQPNTSRE